MWFNKYPHIYMYMYMYVVGDSLWITHDSNLEIYLKPTDSIKQKPESTGIIVLEKSVF